MTCFLSCKLERLLSGLSGCRPAPVLQAPLAPRGYNPPQGCGGGSGGRGICLHAAGATAMRRRGCSRPARGGEGRAGRWEGRAKAPQHSPSPGKVTESVQDAVAWAAPHPTTGRFASNSAGQEGPGHLQPGQQPFTGRQVPAREELSAPV